MHCLNTVILEGKFTKILNKGDKLVYFNLIVRNYRSDIMETEEENISVLCAAPIQFFETVKNKERNIRLVGHLACLNNKTCILCEHIEFKLCRADLENE